ncbi:MAG: hypothetical protein ACI9AB_002108 [Urechidicola sp.]|jgi:hypothetical protein
MMDLVKSLSFHIENYDHMQRLDDKLSPVLKYALSLTCFLAYYSGISFLLKYIVRSALRKKKLANESIVTFVFSKNHELVRRQLADAEISYPVYDLSFQNTTKSSSVKVRYFSSILLILAVLANAKLYLDNVKNYKGNEIVENNKLKVFKLAGYKLFFEILTEDCKLVIKFNDHIFNSMLLHEVCEQQEVKTVYVQHAPVSPRFPALHHDLNVLFSQDSLAKYRTLDVPKKIFEWVDIRLLASERFKKDQLDGRGAVLFAVNILDDLSKVKDLVQELTMHFSVIVRPHPRESRDLSGLLINKVSLSKGTSIWEDMNQCEFVLCNESAVPLEAIYYGRSYYKTAMVSKSMDSYGFMSRGLITEEFKNSQVLIEAMLAGKKCFDESHLNYYIGDMPKYAILAKQLKLEIEALAN